MLVHVYECKCLHIYTLSGISSASAAEHWKQSAGNRCLKEGAGCTDGVMFLQPITQAAAAVSVHCASASAKRRTPAETRSTLNNAKSKQQITALVLDTDTLQTHTSVSVLER